jgi:hypothetical protein
MTELVLSLDIFAALCSIGFLAKFIISGSPIEDIVLFGKAERVSGGEKRSLMNQHIRRRTA